jgi:hypothetical protein
VHVEAVALGVNQAELLLGIISAFAASRYIDRRRQDTLAATDWALFGFLYAVATMLKEGGFLIPGFLLASELLRLDAAPWRQRIRKLAPGYAFLLVVGVTMLLLRYRVLGGAMFSVRPAASLENLDLGDRLVTMLQVVPTWLRLFVFPLRLQVDYHAPDISIARTALGAAILGLAIAAAIVMRKRAPGVAFGLGWCAVALLPVSNLIPTGVLLAERTLFVPSIGVVVATAAAAADWLERSSSIWVRRVLVAVSGAFVIFGIVRSTSRHLVWNTAHLRVVRPVAPR